MQDKASESSDVSPYCFNCPGCEEQVDVAAELSGQLVRCPYCNTDFFASHDQSHLPVVDDTSPNADDGDRESAFDKLRIENYTALRMGAIRARSWWLIGFCMSILVVLEMIGKTIIQVLVFHHWSAGETLRMGIVCLMISFAGYALRRAAELKREIDRSAIPEPTKPPDFSTLNDGTDRWKNLENVR